MLSKTEICQALTRLNLMDASENPVFSELTGGISSEIYKVDLEGKSYCIKSALPTLRSDPDWHVPVSRTEAEWEWLKLAKKIAKNIAPDPLGYDKQTNTLVMSYLEPELYPNWKDLLSHGIIDPNLAEATAERLVMVHNATAGDQNLSQRFSNDKIFYDIRLEAYFIATGRSVKVLTKLMNELVEMAADSKVALVHGDVSPKNILIGPNGPVFLDAECACYGEPAFDAAFCLTHFLLKCLWKPKWKNSYLKCHERFRETYFANAKWLNPTELEQRVTQLHLGMLIARVAGRSKVEYISDIETQELVKSFSTRHLIDQVATTGEVALLWDEILNVS